MSKILATPAAKVYAKDMGINLSELKGSGEYGSISLKDLKNISPKSILKATGVAKNAAKYYGIDLNDLNRSGLKITKNDVVAFAENKKEEANKQTVIEYKGMRKAVGENMMASIHGSAQISHFADIDTTDFMNIYNKTREVFKEKYEMKLTVTDFMIKAVCLTLQKCPKINANFDGKNIYLRDYVNIGLAVAQDGGLVVPVFNNIEQKSIKDICTQRSEIVPKARDNKLSGSYYKGATFTISNTGKSVMNFFTPIINTPEVAILGIGRTEEKPAVKDGQIVIRTFTAFSITIDHRVLDGMDAVNFLNVLNEVISNSVNILV